MKKETIEILINLLYTGKWNLSLQETEQIIRPIIEELRGLKAEPKDSNEAKLDNKR